MTARQIEAAAPGSILWDDAIRGLHVRVFGDRRAFYLKYRTKEGRQRRPKLGDFGTITLVQARELARDRLYLLAQGKDPDAIAPRRTIEDLSKRFTEVHAVKRKPSTQKMYRDAWRHALPIIGRHSVADITRTELADLHYRMKDTPTQANRTLAVMRKAFNLAEVWGWRPQHSNPVHGIDRNKERKRRRLPSPEEAVRLIRTLDKFDHPPFVDYVWLLAMTGARPMEIRTAKREWLKPDGLHLPDSKGGERIIALPAAARDVIAKIMVIKDNPYLIPGRKAGRPLVGTKALWGRLLRGAEIDGLQMRDLRRFFASLGLSAGLTLEAVGQLLGHTQHQTTKTYAYLLTDAANRAAEATASQLVKIRKVARQKR